MLRVRNQVDIEHGLLRLHELFRTTNFKMSHSSCQLVSLYKLHGVSAHLSCSAKVTAVLVEGALANAANDKELSRHDMKQKARQLGWKGNAKETFQDISRYFKKPVEQLWSSNIVNITVYHGTSKVAVPLDTLTNPGNPHVLIETGWDWRPSRNWKSTQKMKSRGDPHILTWNWGPPRPFHQGGIYIDNMTGEEVCAQSDASLLMAPLEEGVRFGCVCSHTL